MYVKCSDGWCWSWVRDPTLSLLSPLFLWYSPPPLYPYSYTPYISSLCSVKWFKWKKNYNNKQLKNHQQSQINALKYQKKRSFRITASLFSWGTDTQRLSELPEEKEEGCRKKIRFLWVTVQHLKQKPPLFWLHLTSECCPISLCSNFPLIGCISSHFKGRLSCHTGQARRRLRGCSSLFISGIFLHCHYCKLLHISPLKMMSWNYSFPFATVDFFFLPVSYLLRVLLVC